MHPQTLRMYEARGLIEPKRSPKGTRLYSQEDVEQAAAHPGDDRRARPQPRRRRARAAPRGGDRRDAGAHRGDRAGSAARAGAARAASSRRCAAPSAPSSVPYRGGLELVRAADVRAPARGTPEVLAMQADRSRSSPRRRSRLRAWPRTPQPAGDAPAPALGAARRDARRCRAPPRRRTPPGGVVLPVLGKLGVQVAALRGGVEQALERAARGGRAARVPRRSRSRAPSSRRCCAPPSARPAGSPTSTSRPSTCCSRSPTSRPRPRARVELCARRRHARAPAAALAEVRGAHRVDRPDARGEVPGARALRPRPHAGRRAGQARPGDRARRGDPPRDPGALAPHQEQPRADRRAGRRQDGDRRGPRAADRLRRRARVAARTARDRAGHRLADRRRQVPRRVRGPPEGACSRRSPRRRAA